MGVGLLCVALPDTECIFVDYTVSLVAKPDSQMVYAKAMGPCSMMNPGTQYFIEGPQSRIVQVAQEVPQKANIQLRSRREGEQLFKLLADFCRIRHVLQFTDQRLGEKIQKMDSALVA